VDAVERLLAMEEIRQLAYRYALALDSRDMDTLVDLFVSRARDGVRRQFNASLRTVGVTILHVTNHIIDLDPDHPERATGAVYCRGEIEDGESWVVQNILYKDRYQREDGSWRFVNRDHLLWYGADILQRPIGLPPANWPEHNTGKGVLPEQWETWRRFWGE
jgi:hypothetical protein